MLVGTVAVLLAALILAGCSAEAGDVAEVQDDAAGNALVQVPDVIGADAEEAQQSMSELGLSVALDPDRDAAGCTVQEQDPAAGETESESQVTLTLDCRQVDWENQEGESWDAYLDAYTTGYSDGCEALFAMSVSGLLFEQGAPRELGTHDVDECVGEAGDPLDPPADVPDEPEADGTEAGTQDGCQATFDLASDSILFERSIGYTVDDCLNAAAGSAAGEEKPNTKKTPSVRVPSTGPLPNGVRNAKKTSDLYRVGRADWNAYSPRIKLQAAEAFLGTHSGGLGL